MPLQAPNQVSTIVTINGESIDLKGLSVENGQVLYSKLDAKHQQLADLIADIVKNYQSMVTVDLPDGMDMHTALNKFASAVKKGGGKLAPDADKWLKDIGNTGLGRIITNNPGTRAITGTVEGLEWITKQLSDFADGFRNHGPVDTLKNIRNASGAAIEELGNKFDSRFSNVTDAQARAMGAAYAALMADKMNPVAITPENEKLFKPTGMDKVTARAGTIFDNIGAFIRDKIPAIPAALKFVGNGFKDWNGAMDAVKAKQGTEVEGYEERLAKTVNTRAEKKARPQIAQALEAAGEIGGLNTANLSKVITNGAIYRDQNGVYQEVGFKDGIPTASPVKDDKGNVITADAKVNEKINKILPPMSLAGVAGMTAKFAAVADVAHGFGRGVLSPTFGVNNALGKELAVLKAEADAARHGKAVSKGWLGLGKPTYGPAGSGTVNTTLADALDDKVAKLEEKIAARSNVIGKTMTGWANAASPGWRNPLRWGNHVGSAMGKTFGYPISWAANAFGFGNPAAASVNNLIVNASGQLVPAASVSAEAKAVLGAQGKGTIATMAAYDLFDMMRGGNVALNSAEIAGGTGFAVLANKFTGGRFKIISTLGGYLFGKTVAGETEKFVENKFFHKATNPEMDPGLQAATLDSISNADKIKMLQANGIEMNDLIDMRQYNEQNKNAVVNPSSLKVQGGTVVGVL